VSARTFVVFMGVLAVVGLLAYGLITKGEARVAVGEEFPDAELPKLDGSGTGSLADYAGEWVLVNVWASWCGPCREESPTLQRFHEEHRDADFTVLGIDSRDVSEKAREFVAEYKLTYPQLHDGSGEQPDELGMTGFPESFLVNPEGEIALVTPGPVDEKYLTENVEPLIEETS
jgi:cytochrome c biogenesis protein CcmG/thiol:disulfide interchange protein DsbE